MMDLKDIQINMKNVSGSFFDAGRNVWLVGLGLLSTVEEQSRRQLENLVEKGSGTGDRFQKLINEAMERLPVTVKGRRMNDLFKQSSNLGLHRLGIPSQNEINTLIERVEQLTQKIEEIKNPV